MINRRSVFFPFLALLVFVISVGCLCTGLSNQVTETEEPAPPPTQAPVQQPTKAPPTEAPVTEAPVSNNNNNNNSGGLKTFTDQNNFYTIEVPADWEYSQSVEGDDTYSSYIDTFVSPDGGAVIENIVYIQRNTPFVGGQNGKFALAILNQLYSKTGREGDIRISDDQIMKDGSERLTWTSKEGQYSGISYFEVREKYNFLMFTVNWGNDMYDTYFDTLNSVIESYRIP